MAAVGGVNLAEFQAAAQLALNPPPAGAAAEVVQRYGAGVAAVNTFKAAPDAWRSALAIFPAVTSVHARFICLQAIQDFLGGPAFATAAADVRSGLGPALVRLASDFLASIGRSAAARQEGRQVLMKLASALGLALRASFVRDWRGGVAAVTALGGSSADGASLACHALMVLHQEIAPEHTGGRASAEGDAVKDALRSDAGGLPAISTFLLGVLHAHYASAPYTAVLALEVLAAFVGWADLALVVNAPMLGALAQLLTVPHPELRAKAVGVLAAAVEKGKLPVAQVEALLAMDVVATLGGMALGSAEDDMEEADVNEAVAALVSAVGRRLLRAGDAPEVLAAPAAKAAAAALLAPCLELALRLFATPAYGNASAVALVELWEALVAFWRAGARGEGVPKKHGSGAGAAGCKGVPAGVALGEWLERLLPLLTTRAKYPPGFDPQSGSMDEEEEALVRLRHSTKGLLKTVTGVAPGVVLTLLLRLVGATPPAAPPGADPTDAALGAALSEPAAGVPGELTKLSALPMPSAELVLWLAWAWGEGVGRGQAAVLRAPPVPWLLVCLHEGALAGGGHRAAAVQLAYLDLALRYAWVLTAFGRGGSLLPRVLTHVLGGGGLASEFRPVRARAAYVALRLVRGVAAAGDAQSQAALAPLVDGIVGAVGPHLKFAYRPPGAGGAGGVTTASGLGLEDQQALFELVGVILAQPWVPPAAAGRTASAVIAPLLADAAAGAARAQSAVASVGGAHAGAGAGGAAATATDEEADGGTGVGAWMGHAMGCIARALKAFSAAPPGLEGDLDRALTLAWQAPQLLPGHLGLRSKAIVLTRRMIPLLGPALLRVLPTGLGVLLDTPRGAALGDAAQLLQRCLEAYAAPFVPLLRSALGALVPRLWAALAPALEAARAQAAADAAGNHVAVVRSDAAAEGGSMYGSYLALLRRMAVLGFGLDALLSPDAPDGGAGTLGEILGTTAVEALRTLADPGLAKNTLGLFRDTVSAWLPEHALAVARAAARGAAAAPPLARKPLLLDMQDSADSLGDVAPGSSGGGGGGGAVGPAGEGRAGAAAPLPAAAQGEFVRILRDVWLPLSLHALLRASLPVGDASAAALANEAAGFHMACADRLGLSSPDPAAGAAGVAFCQLLASKTLPAAGVPAALAAAYSQRVHEATLAGDVAAQKALGGALLELVGALRGAA